MVVDDPTIGSRRFYMLLYISEVTEKTSTDTSLETPAKQSLANDSQYLLISMDSVTSLRDYIQDDMNCDVDGESYSLIYI